VETCEVAPQEVKLSSTTHGMVGTMLSRTRAGSAGELRQLANAGRVRGLAAAHRLLPGAETLDQSRWKLRRRREDDSNQAGLSYRGRCELVLSTLWITALLVFAYVDIFGFYRADALDAALDGRLAAGQFTVDQMFLSLTLIYILPPILMVVLSLVLKPRVNRITNIVVSVLYAVSIAVSCIGEAWVYYILGSVIEVILLLAIARVAWRWPPPHSAPSQS